jgi:hypothetical protein
MWLSSIWQLRFSQLWLWIVCFVGCDAVQSGRIMASKQEAGALYSSMFTDVSEELTASYSGRGLIFQLENWRSTFLRNVDKILPELRRHAIEDAGFYTVLVCTVALDMICPFRMNIITTQEGPWVQNTTHEFLYSLLRSLVISRPLGSTFLSAFSFQRPWLRSPIWDHC